MRQNLNKDKNLSLTENVIRSDYCGCGLFDLAKIAHWNKDKSEERLPFSMSDVKTLYNNQLLLDLFLEEFGINPYLPKNKRRLHKLRRVGLIAA